MFYAVQATCENDCNVVDTAKKTPFKNVSFKHIIPKIAPSIALAITFHRIDYNRVVFFAFHFPTQRLPLGKFDIEETKTNSVNKH